MISFVPSYTLTEVAPLAGALKITSQYYQGSRFFCQTWNKLLQGFNLYQPIVASVGYMGRVQLDIGIIDGKNDRPLTFSGQGTGRRRGCKGNLLAIRTP